MEAVIFCEDPVASMLHRGVAAALDGSIVLIGYALFLVVFRLLGGEFDLNQTNLMLFGAVLPLLTFAYGLLWAIAGRETPGMVWTHLHLTTFEGFEPERQQFLTRFVGSCLSLSTVLGPAVAPGRRGKPGLAGPHVAHFPYPGFEIRLLPAPVTRQWSRTVSAARCGCNVRLPRHV